MKENKHFVKVENIVLRFYLRYGRPLRGQEMSAPENDEVAHEISAVRWDISTSSAVFILSILYPVGL